MSTDNNQETHVEDVDIPEGVPRSGRVWKKKQAFRSSSQKRKGVLSHLAKTKDEANVNRQKLQALKAFEKELKSETNRVKMEARIRREEHQKRRAANEYKTAVYQPINAEKIKGMSKKQLRSIKKTSVNKFGQVELVNPWSGK
jgi:hypothetical protein